MNKVFCASCGFKILYEVTKPKFCSTCGESVEGISSASKKEGEGGELEIDMDKLKKDISIEGDSEKTTLKSLWSASSSPRAGGGFSRPPSNDPEGQTLLDKTVKDCSSSRTKDIDE
jgi:DNA-directed RNA polymerase subunit RPC12/RpoP